MTTRPQKITFGEMREASRLTGRAVRGAVDRRHHTAASADEIGRLRSRPGNT
jgi:hypothetical protein